MPAKSSKGSLAKQENTATKTQINPQDKNVKEVVTQKSKEDYHALATSFNDLLLGEPESLQRIVPNEVELYIIKQLNALLQGDIPDAVVPRLPEVAMTLLKELAYPNISVEEIRQQVIRDPVLASDILKMSNSALFRTNDQEKIVNLESAVLLLGLDNLKAIVSSVLMKRLVLIAPIYFKMFGQHLWQHSLDCAQACKALAKFYGQSDPNNAYLVGLMHDIGKLAIFALLIKALGAFLDYKPRGAVFSNIIRDHSLQLSAKIAQKWALPDYLLVALTGQAGVCDLSQCSIYGFVLNQANILSEFKVVAETAVKDGVGFHVLLEQYSIPQHLFEIAFPDIYVKLLAVDYGSDNS